jgi:NADH-quinone oxidoreductase subunit D
MMADLPDGWIDQLRDFLDTFPNTLDEIDRCSRRTRSTSGARNVGAITAEDAINYGLTGPNLRASGVPYDVRKDRPYYDYETYDFEVPWAGEHGDCYDRYLCRMEEMRQSVRILGRRSRGCRAGPSTWRTRASRCPPRRTAWRTWSR